VRQVIAKRIIVVDIELSVLLTRVTCDPYGEITFDIVDSIVNAGSIVTTRDVWSTLDSEQCKWRTKKMVAQKKLEDMTEAELDAYIEKANKLKEEKKKFEAHITKAKEQIDAILLKHSLTIEDVYPEKLKNTVTPKERKRAPVKFYYRNPDNHDEIYKRSGKKPAWLQPAFDRHGKEACRVGVDQV
jgi:DNA-binding protein H-NS